MRFFNTSGPVVAADHYLVPPLDRLDIDELRGLVRDKRYFVLHAPRQSGKTSVLLAVRDLLESEGCSSVYASFEVARALEDNERAVRAVLAQLGSRARRLGDDFVDDAWPDILEKYGPDTALGELLSRWAEQAPKPLVLLIDEIDALAGAALVSVLAQLRAGYDQRPDRFPHSIVLCGLRDVRDYRIDRRVSPFNIVAKSLRLGDFSKRQVASLLGQHTDDTGQRFAPGAVDRLWEETQGQPWLVNALAAAACFEGEAACDRSREIGADDVGEARERVVLRRATHLDQLARRLREGRVRRVVEPIIGGGGQPAFGVRDLEYVRDLGLVAPDEPLRIANPIYAEVIPRELTAAAQAGLAQEPAWYVRADGSLDLPKLMQAFQRFFREHSEHWSKRFRYQEAWPQLLLQAFLQRVVNSGGRIEREYGLGRGRTDLLIAWPGGPAAGRYVVECKLYREKDGLEAVVGLGLEQTAAYMDRCDAEEGHLVLFDRDSERSWEEKLFHRHPESEAGLPVHVWGM